MQKIVVKKVKHILGIIENKLSMIEIQKNIENRSSSNEQRQKLISCININNNPFLRSEDIKKIDNYFRNKNYINDFTLTNLQRLLYERIIINESQVNRNIRDCTYKSKYEELKISMINGNEASQELRTSMSLAGFSKFVTQNKLVEQNNNINNNDNSNNGENNRNNYDNIYCNINNGQSNLYTTWNEEKTEVK